MNLALAKFILARPCGFVTQAEMPELIGLDRLCPLVVRCGCCRFICGAQDLQTLINYVRAGGDYVRDVSVHPDTIRQAKEYCRPCAGNVGGHPGPAPDEGDYGGAFDGNQVISDADPGL